MPCIHPGECDDGGACEPVCPAGAIVCEDDVPGQWAQFTGESVRFSGQPGSPGGAAKTGRCPMAPAMSPATSPATAGAVARPTAAQGAAPR
jgi:ferredoxin